MIFLKKIFRFINFKNIDISGLEVVQGGKLSFGAVVTAVKQAQGC
jgi:hypothetical protein